RIAAMTARSSAPGRPAGGDSDRVRTDLLDAARTHFLSNEFKAVSLRHIAETAGVNAAMVNYYFGGKQGLYLAMVDELLQSISASLEEIGRSESLTITEFARRYSLLLAQNPWWPNFMVREVLFSDGEIRSAILDKLKTLFAPSLLGLIQKEIDSGNYREDLNPRLALLSLMGMSIFPFLARPMLSQVLNMEMTDSQVATMSQHNAQLFLRGVTAIAGKVKL
ncbi:MAG: TetR family transcriptional regulator, partial [Gammaproteobacteria bacterium]